MPKLGGGGAGGKWGINKGTKSKNRGSIKGEYEFEDSSYEDDGNNKSKIVISPGPG